MPSQGTVGRLNAHEMSFPGLIHKAQQAVVQGQGTTALGHDLPALSACVQIQGQHALTAQVEVPSIRNHLGRVRDGLLPGTRPRARINALDAALATTGGGGHKQVTPSGRQYGMSA